MLHVSSEDTTEINHTTKINGPCTTVEKLRERKKNSLENFSHKAHRANILCVFCELCG
jgi:hypothetical protein